MLTKSPKHGQNHQKICKKLTTFPKRPFKQTCPFKHGRLGLLVWTNSRSLTSITLGSLQCMGSRHVRDKRYTSSSCPHLWQLAPACPPRPAEMLRSGPRSGARQQLQSCTRPMVGPTLEGWLCKESFSNYWSSPGCSSYFTMLHN